MSEISFHEVRRDFVRCFEGLTGRYAAIIAAQLTISDEFHRMNINESVRSASPAAIRFTRGVGTNAARTNTTKAAIRNARCSISKP